MRKLSYEFVKSEFEKEGYTLLTDHYINNSQRLEFVCPFGHRHGIRFGNWTSGYRCGVCGNIRAGKKRGLDFEFVKNRFEDEGYKLLSKEYKGPHKKLDYVCPEGHICNATWAKWYYADQKCVFCSKRPPILFEDVKKSFQKEGYILLSGEYISGRKLKYMCPNGHKSSMTWDNWRYLDRRCPRCNGQVSRWEQTVKTFVKDLGIKFLSNDRSVLVNPNTGNFLELDVWIPDKQKAIECNGEYWHNQLDKIELDKIKQVLCHSAGIDLLVVTDLEWKEDINKTKEKIKKFIGE